MLVHFANSLLRKHLIFDPTNSQEIAISKLAEFIVNPVKEDIFILKGYAGTGKTTVLSAVIHSLQDLKLQSILLAPTGRAAKVLTKYSGREAFTIHKKIYKQKSASSEHFVLDINLHSHTVFIVDEASMVNDQTYEHSAFGSGRLLEDLLTYVYNGKGCSLILTGDIAQLPPVGLDSSLALDKSYIEQTYLRNVIEASLTDVVRQSQKSGILLNATKIRELISKGKPCTPKFVVKQFKDISRLEGTELIEKISSSFDKYGIDDTIIITRSNKRANRYNQGIRKSILYKEEEISIGDYVMIVKNNYFNLDKIEEIDFIANGDIAKVARIKKYYELYGLRFADVVLKFIDYKDLEIERRIVLDTLTAETPTLTAEQMNAFTLAVLEDYPEVKSKREKYKKLREDPFYNALQVKFSYAVTCHKAQGGQWDSVFIDHDYLPDELISIENLRWFYTAFTRASKTLYLVNFKDLFFNNNE